MTKSQVAAYVQAQSIAALAEIEGMKAHNEWCKNLDHIQPYSQEAFLLIIDNHGLHHNAIMTLYQGATDE